MPTEPTAGELALFAEGLILVESFEALTILGEKIGVPGKQVVVALGFDGRVNNSTERRTVHVALSPRDAAQLVRTLAESYAGAFGPRDAFGRPQ